MSEISRAPAHGGRDEASARLFGYWVYIMSDCILFGSLFATYAVLVGNTAGGPSGRQVFELPGVIAETACLLASSFFYGLATLQARSGRRAGALAWLVPTFVLGAAFIALELSEFSRLISADAGPQASGFLSAFFALVATHGLHVTTGLVWMLVLWLQIAAGGLTEATGTRVMSLGLFWHFLDIVWILIFTFVYLSGVMS